ncbi:MAG: sigma-70 family RNA polymerase sigma factor [Roseiflexaceae bacterium]
MIWPWQRRPPPQSEPESLAALEQYDDATLFARARRKDESAFAVLYARHYQRVYRYIAYRTDRLDVAEDLTAEVFLNAWNAVERVRSEEVPARAWLLRMAHNEVVDYYRTRRATVPLPDGETLVAALVQHSPEPDVERRAEYTALVNAVQQLPDEWRQLIVLRFVEGLSFEEIGVILGKQSNACRQLQHRALGRLRDVLQSAEGRQSHGG